MMTATSILLLHGFKKKKDKTSSKEIKIAKERLAIVLEATLQVQFKF